MRLPSCLPAVRGKARLAAAAAAAAAATAAWF